MNTQDTDDVIAVRGIVEEVVDSVRELGERARLLAVNLAVAAAKLQQTKRYRGTFNNDILDLVAKVTRVSQSVGDAVSAVEKGLPATKVSTPALMQSWQGVGVPDEDTLVRLGRSLEDTLALAGQIMRELCESGTGTQSSRPVAAPSKTRRADETSDPLTP